MPRSQLSLCSDHWGEAVESSLGATKFHQRNWFSPSMVHMKPIWSHIQAPVSLWFTEFCNVLYPQLLPVDELVRKFHSCPCRKVATHDFQSEYQQQPLAFIVQVSIIYLNLYLQFSERIGHAAPPPGRCIGCSTSQATHFIHIVGLVLLALRVLGFGKISVSVNIAHISYLI